mgnify:CR=1 FL=1
MSTDIFSEIDEDLRRQKLERIWKTHGRTILVVGALLLLASGAYAYWQGRQMTRLEAATATLTTSLQKLKDDNREAILGELSAFAPTAPEGQARLAKLYASTLADKLDKDEQAKTELTTLAEDSRQPALYRDFARLLLVYRELDTGDPIALQNRLSPLKGKDKPWRFAAEELSALLSLKQGDSASAKAALERLQADKDAPQGVRERATRILSTL